MTIKLLEDISNIGVKDLMTIYGSINQANIDKGFANTKNYVDELKAQEGLLKLRTQVDQTQGTNLLTTNQYSQYIGYGLLVVGLGLVAWLVVKK